MIDTFRSNVLFLDATDKDSEEHDRVKVRMNEDGRWQQGIPRIERPVKVGTE